ncbi:MAG: hypothetical protein V4819_11800 [Verrucomicrobiota bacterium]
MTESTDAFVAAAVRPLTGDAETRAAAATLLGSLREERPDQEEAALKCWNAPAGEKRRLSWRAVFHLTVAIISILLLAQATMDLLGYWKILRLNMSYGDDVTQEQLDPARFNGPERRLLKINPQSPVELAKDLWDSQPENPAYFAEYCAAYVSDHTKLPPDFLGQARQIDPNNSYFPFWAAAVEAKDAAKQRPLSKSARAARVAPEWDVLNELKIDQALAILHGSLNLPDCRNYDVQMARERIPLLPQDTPFEYYRSLSILAMTTTSHQSSWDLSSAIAAKAWLLGGRGDAEGLISLKEDLDFYLKSISRTEPGFIIQDILIEIGARTALKSLAASAAKLGLAEMAAEVQARLDRLEKLTADRKAVVFEIDGQDPLRQLGVLNRESLPYLAERALHPPVLTDRDVKPARMIEFEILAQLCIYGTWTLLGIAAGMAALDRFRSPPVIRGLSARMELLLRPADWVWLCTAGIPPFVYCLFITHLTPLGGSGANILAGFINLPYFDGVLLPMAQFTGLFFMMLILPILVARWRLGKRAASFGFGKARLWPGALAFVGAAAFIPVLGWAVTRDSEVALKISWGLFVIPIAWILAVVIRTMTAGGTHLLHLATASRVLVPAYLAAMVILLTATPCFMVSRQHWFEQDRMNRLDAGYPSLTKFEYELSVAARQELREALGYEH